MNLQPKRFFFLCGGSSLSLIARCLHTLISCVTFESHFIQTSYSLIVVAVVASMEGFPERLSAAFSGLLDELREELNEIKQSNTTQLRKVGALEKSRDATDAHQEGLRQQLDEHENLIADAGTSLAELRAENKSLREANDEILRQHK